MLDVEYHGDHFETSVCRRGSGSWDLNLFSVPGDQFTNNSLLHPPVSYRLVLHQSDPNVMKLENTNRFLLLTLNQQMHCTLKVKKFMINQ